jgi:hypothetical protein
VRLSSRRLTGPVVLAPSEGTVVSATAAAWIMERPVDNNNIPFDLAGYALASMSAASTGVIAPDGSVDDVSYQGEHYNNALPDPTSLQLTMQNGNNVLSQVLPIDENTMFFIWGGFH